MFTNPQRYYAFVAENRDTPSCDSPPGTLCYTGAIRGQLAFAPGFGPLPNTAMAAPVADRREAVLPALGILMVLIAATMFARRRWAGL